MNANDLADAMEIRASIRRKATSRKSVQENTNDRLADQLDQAATMLRQQQAQIEALKLSLSGHSAEILSKNDETLPNGKCEPVAWMEIEYGGFTEYKVWREPVSSKSIPLYTHPVKTPRMILDGNRVYPCLKELTDDEIEPFISNLPESPSNDELYEFAYAVLRKAQE